MFLTVAWLCPLTLLILSSVSAQDGANNDPIGSFCRRWAHQTCIIDDKLYIDGGLVGYGTAFTNDSAETNTWLLFEDTSVVNETSGFPDQYDNLTKPSNVPSLQGGILWPDVVNKVFYLYGGEHYGSVADTFTLWFFDTISNTWSQRYAGGSQGQIQRASFGAGVTIDDRGWAYYYGGWLNSANVPGWYGPPMALNSMLKYDMIDGIWTNVSYDPTPRAEGVMLYIPASDRGMLVYFGGLEMLSNGSYTGVPMESIYLFDIASEKWYMQTASGSVPQMRRRFCAGVTWADDQSSYNIYIYGGLTPAGDGLGDVYILSMPSFEWLLWYPNVTTTTFQHGKGMSSCNVIGSSQLMIIGGYYTNLTYDDCDTAVVWGQHNLAMGMQNIADAQWYQLLPNVTTYEVPPNVTAVVGGGPTGGATMTAPSNGWATTDLAIYFGRQYSPLTRTATRSLPTSATTSAAILTTSSMVSPPSAAVPPAHHTNVGAIAGGAAGGGVAFIIAVCLLAWCCLRRRKRRVASGNASQPPVSEGRGMAQSPSSALSKPTTSFSQDSPNVDHNSSRYYSSQASPPLQERHWSPQSMSHSQSWQQTGAPHFPGQPAPSAGYFNPSAQQPLQHQQYYPQQPQLQPHQQQTYYPPPPDSQHEDEPVITLEMPSVRSPVNLDSVRESANEGK